MTRLHGFFAIFALSAVGLAADLNLPADFRAEVTRRVNEALADRADLRKGAELALAAFGRRLDADVARMKSQSTNAQKESWTPTTETVVAEIASNAKSYGGAEPAQIVIDAVVRANAAHLALQPVHSSRAARTLRVLNALEKTELAGLGPTARDLYREAFANAPDATAMANLTLRASTKGIAPPPLSADELVEAIGRNARRLSSGSTTDPVETISRALDMLRPAASASSRWGGPNGPDVVAKPERAWGLIARDAVAEKPTKEALLFATKLVKATKFPEAERARSERAAYVAALRDETLRKAMAGNGDWDALRKRVEYNAGAERLAKMEAGLELPPFASGAELRDFVSALVLDVRERFPESPQAFGEVLYGLLRGTLPTKDVGDFLMKELARLASPESGVSPKVLEYVLGKLLPEAMRLPVSGDVARSLVDALEKRAASPGGDSTELRRLRGESYRFAFRRARGGLEFGGVLATLMGGQARTAPFAREELGRILVEGLRRTDWKGQRSVADSFDYVLRMVEDAAASKWDTLKERFPGPPPLNREALVRALALELEMNPDPAVNKTVGAAIKMMEDRSLGGRDAAAMLRRVIAPQPATATSPSRPSSPGLRCEPRTVGALVQ